MPPPQHISIAHGVSNLFPSSTATPTWLVLYRTATLLDHTLARSNTGLPPAREPTDKTADTAQTGQKPRKLGRNRAQTG
eukprot:3941648-Rhodomonas_salina.3